MTYIGKLSFELVYRFERGVQKKATLLVVKVE